MRRRGVSILKVGSDIVVGWWWSRCCGSDEVRVGGFSSDVQCVQVVMFLGQKFFGVSLLGENGYGTN